MTDAGVDDDLVHSPLARWARERPSHIALDDGQHPLTFAALQEAVQAHAQQLAQQAAPTTVLVNEQAGTVQQLVAFLGIIASSRCAAVGDPDWPVATRAAVHAAIRHAASPLTPVMRASALSPFYVGFTSGSTGLPKGFQRHHRSWAESFRACVDTFGPDAQATVLAPGRISHSLFLFGMLLGLWTGGGVVVQERFSAARALSTLQAGRTPCLIAVPSLLLMMLEHARRRDVAPIAGVRLILISGARWMRDRTPDLQALFPNARIIEFYGASETSFIAWMEADEQLPAAVVGHPFAQVDIDIRDREGDTGPGLIYVRSPMLFNDYVGGEVDGTAALRDGDWLSVRDMGYLDSEGRLCLVGRQNRMLVTQGKNLFPEEVEAVLTTFPGVTHASVQGMPDPVRGQQVVAVLHLSAPVDVTALMAWCRQRLEPYKTPRHFWHCPQWPQTASGKTDHPALALALQRQMQAELQRAELPRADLQKDEPCLHPMP
jgi:acyl-CoA synthetase (AMP-forming)/AMP-acid ligase II